MPQLEVAVIARPTSSRSLYAQMVGRVLRLHPGKHRALVIDVVGASHGAMTLASAADLSTSSETEATKARRRGQERARRRPPTAFPTRSRSSRWFSAGCGRRSAPRRGERGRSRRSTIAIAGDASAGDRGDGSTECGEAMLTPSRHGAPT